jgi:hypothetical protein
VGRDRIYVDLNLLDDDYAIGACPTSQVEMLTVHAFARELGLELAARAWWLIQTIAVAPEEFATERLDAERLRVHHLQELADLHREERTMVTLGGPRPVAATETFVETNLEHWWRNGFGLWVFRRTSDGAFVGRAGLRRVHVGDADEVEIAYVLKSEMWAAASQRRYHGG